MARPVRYPTRKNADNALRVQGSEHTLQCGHETSAPPIVIYSDGRKLYMCPNGCGLKKAKRR